MKHHKALRYFVVLSKTDGKLDPEKVLFIAKKLSPRELLSYYQLLRSERKQEKVFVTTAMEMPKGMQAKIERMFSQKEVLFAKDEAILAGMTVQISDLIFKASLRDYLFDVKQQYEEGNI